MAGMSDRRKLRAVDAAWLRMDRPPREMVITSLFTFERPLGFAEVTALVEDRLMRIRRFRERVVPSRLGPPRWEPDPTFDLGDHLRRNALPEPGGDAELLALVEEIAEEPLDHAHPLWRIHAVEGYRGGGAIVTRIHHCIGDGVALIAMLLGLTDEGRGMTVPEVGVAAPRPQGLAGWGRAALVQLGTLGHLLALPADPPSPLRGRVGPRRHLALSPPISIDTIKRIREAHGVTFNDVVVAAIAGALRRYLAGRGFAASDRDLRAMMPMYVRAEDTAGTLGNHFGLVYLDLPLREPDAPGRLAATHRRMQAIKGSPEATVALEVLGAIGAAPQPVEDLAISLFTRKASVMITNVAGPPGRLHLLGHAITSIAVWAPVSGVLGLAISVLSYAGAARIAVEGNAEIVRDPAHLVELIVAELDELVVVAPPPPVPPRPPEEHVRW